MKHIIKYSLLLPLVVVLTACETIIDVDTEDIDPYAVLMSRAEPDSLLTVRMTWSRYTLDNHPFRPITDATVSLELNGTAVSSSNLSDGNYRFAVVPQPGDTMTLTAYVPDGDRTLTAGARVPLKPNFDIVELVADTTSSYGDVYYRMRIKVTDPSHHGFYKLMVFPSDWTFPWVDSLGSYDWSQPTIDSSYSYSTYIRVKDPVLTDASAIEALSDDDGFNGREFMFTSEHFVGDSYEFNVEFSQYSTGLGYYVEDVMTVAPFKVKMTAMSYDYYRYEVTRDGQSTVQTIFMEPVQVYCNVDGGLGIFGALSKAERSISTVRYEHFHFDNGGGTIFKQQPKKR